MKKKKFVICFAVIIILFGLCSAAACKRPDLIFLAKEQVSLFFRHADLKEIDTADLNLILINPGDPDSLSAVSSIGQEMMLINETHPLPADFSANVVEYKTSGVWMDSALTEPYRELSEKILEAFDTPLYIRSSYRTREEQEQEKEAQPASAATPGTSEHEAGLALDVYVPRYAGYGFLKSAAGQYVNKNCWKYGFVIRYPPDGKKSTGIPFEPWHLRYVGIPHAEIMYKNSWTLEEYLTHLETGKFYQNGSYLISRQTGDTLILPENLTELSISSDNQGGYIISGIYTR